VPSASARVVDAVSAVPLSYYIETFTMAQSTDRNRAIDSLRGIAALAVLVFHARIGLWVGTAAWLKTGELDWFNPDTILGFFSFPFRWGYWGVPLFFVISGYCIHRPEIRKLKADPSYRLSLGNYAARRIWRIYPVLLAALLLTAGLDHLTRTLSPTNERVGDDSLFCFAVNLSSLQGIVASSYGSNFPLWTLAVEIHFYLVYPLFFWASSRFGGLASTAMVFGFSAASWLLLETIGFKGTLFLPYWFSWAVGAYIAEAEVGSVRRPGPWLVGLAIPCMILALTEGGWKGLVVDSLPVVYSLLALPFALLVWYAVSRPMSRVWNNRISLAAASVGLFSYSLYATHLPVLNAYVAAFQGSNKSNAFVAIIPGIVFAIVIAFAVYLVVEQWTLRLPGRSQRILGDKSICCGVRVVSDK
jgi:peptidoglycan/LPS O-acetylase OafA/YrhL